MSVRRKRRWPWIVGAIVVVLLVPVAFLALPILLHQDGGSSTQHDTGEQWPTTVSATGDDDRTREITVLPSTPGGEVDTSSLTVGERLVVSGTGFDGGQGIYVAICKIPDAAGERPGPCLGGVPEQEATEGADGAVQWAPSNWINDEWGWKLFGARPYDDVASGTFTAYLEVVSPVGEGVDCTVDACAIYTRNDHTALGDRVQDVYVPVGFAG